MIRVIAITQKKKKKKEKHIYDYYSLLEFFCFWIEWSTEY